MINDTDANANAIKELENELLTTEWVKEAEQIPLDKVEKAEQIILIKCINRDYLTEDEKTQLKEILQRYRPAIEKLEPVETLENIKNNIQFVEDEKTFLKLVEDNKKNNIITMYYPLNNEQELKLVFDIYPVTDSQAVLGISENLNFFKDFTEKEINIYNDYKNGAAQTREEIAIAENLNKKIEKLTQEKQVEIMQEFLARQTKFHNKNSSYDEMLKVFQNMQLGYVALLFQKVQNITGLADIEVERVFREFD